MKVQVGSYYTDPAKGAEREIHVTMDEADGERFFQDQWEGMDMAERFRCLASLCDVYQLAWAVEKRLRSVEPARDEMQRILKSLKKPQQ